MTRVLSSTVALAAVLFFAASVPTLEAAEQDDTSVRLFNMQKSLAEKKGDAQSQYYLAQMYEYGLGTDEDPRQARLWYERAAAKGHPVAKRQLTELTRAEHAAAEEQRRAAEQLKAATLAPPERPEPAPVAAPRAAEPVRAVAPPPRVPSVDAHAAEQARRQEAERLRAERKRQVQAMLRERLANPTPEPFE